MTRLLLVGHGRWGQLLRARFDELLGPENVYIADVDGEQVDFTKASRAVVQNGRRTSRDYRVLFDDVDAVVVATPPHTHHEIAMAALNAGKHVLVEKPMTLFSGQAHELAQLAGEKHLTLMVDSTWEYNMWAVGALHWGGVTNMRMSWTNPRTEVSPAGILWEQGAHPIALMIRLFRRLPTDVTGSVEEREARLFYRFENGSALVHLSWAANVQRRRTVAVENIFGNAKDDAWTFDDGGDIEYAPEPLTVMCQTFLGRIKASVPFIDHCGVAVVDVLSWTEEQLHV